MATVWDLWLRRTTFAVTGPTSDRYGRSNPTWVRRLALAPARRLEVAPLRVGWCVWLIFSDWGLRRHLVERSP
jgi:hypothetical protein